MWLLVCLYQPLTGILWPIVERYLSGGRSGHTLRAALGRWNAAWSSALVVGLAAIGAATWYWGPDRFAQPMIAWLGAVHVVSVVLVLPMGREPGAHIAGRHDPHPPVYERMLTTFRILLPTSYIALTALSPFLPTVTARLGVPDAWQSPVGATWTAARVCTFLILERWHAWHGRWWPATAAVALLLGGFALSILAPHLVGRGDIPAAALTGANAPLPPLAPLGTVLLALGLIGVGLGMATIYTASLYYAMECERDEVEAGSRHEALIGLGYTVGPGCGLLGIASVSAGLAPTGSGDAVMLGLVGVIALGLVSTAAARGLRGVRTPAPPGP
jgi:hypothetical protein